MRPYALAALAAVLLAGAPAFAGDNYVYVRTNPLAFTVHGKTISPQPGGGKVGWYPDLFGVGFSYRKADIAFHMTTMNPFPDSGSYSVLYGRLAAAYRPLKEGPLSVVDPYMFAGVGFGGAGRYELQDASCTNTTTDECSRSRASFGGGLQAGLGLDVNFTIARLAQSGQRLSAFVGVELRGELFFSHGANLFTVYSMPIGLRLD